MFGVGDVLNTCLDNIFKILIYNYNIYYLTIIYDNCNYRNI